MERKTVFAIEGPIGIGKSTVLKFLETKENIKVYPEPLDEWQPWLERFYAGARTIEESVELQYNIVKSMVARAKKIVEDEARVIVMERSLDSNLFVFMQSVMDRTEGGDWADCLRLYSRALHDYERDTDEIRFIHIGLDGDFEDIYFRAKNRHAVDCLASKAYHEHIYQRCNAFQYKCHEKIFVVNRDPPHRVCARVMSAINKYL